MKILNHPGAQSSDTMSSVAHDSTIAVRLSELEDLQERLKNLKMKTDDVQTQIQILKKERLLQQHHSKITEPKENYPYWLTRIKTEDGKYKNIKSRSYQGLLDKLYAHYYSGGLPKAEFTLKDAWEGYCANASVSGATIFREQQRWNRYFAGRKTELLAVKKLSKSDLKDILEKLIKEYQLNWKETRAAKAILAMALNYAKDQGIIASNPAENIKELKLNKRLCRAAIRPGDKARRYGREEYDAFIKAAYQRLDEHPETISPAAALLIMHTAARIGEVAGMMFSDIDFERKTWQIARIETVDEKGQPCIENHGKGKSVHALRKIALTDECLDLIRLAGETNETYGYSESDYVFCNPNGRITRTAIDHMFRTICSMIGMEKAKSAHDARRTVLSLLYAGLGPEQIDAIRRFAGHASIQQTLSYIFGLDTTETEDTMIRNVLSGKKNSTETVPPTANSSEKMSVKESSARKKYRTIPRNEYSTETDSVTSDKIVQFPTKAV